MTSITNRKLIDLMMMMISTIEIKGKIYLRRLGHLLQS